MIIFCPCCKQKLNWNNATSWAHLVAKAVHGLAVAADFFSKICCSQGWLAASSELLHIRAVLLSLLQRSEGRGLYSCTAKGSSIYFIHKHVRPTLCPEMHQQSAGRSEQSFWAAQEEMELWLKAEAGPPSSTLANSSPLVCHTLCLGGDRVRGEADSRRALGLRGVQVTWQSFGEAF